MFKRYLRLYGYFVRFSFSRAMEFRFDFWFRIIMDLVYYAANLLFFKILMMHTSTVAGWTEPQIMIFVSGYLLIDAINMTLFANNTWQLPMMINKGDLDYYLVRPVNSLFFLSFRDFAANSFINLICALGIMLWAMCRFPGDIYNPFINPSAILSILGYLSLLFIGTGLVHMLNMILLIAAFWTHSARGFGQVFWIMTRFMERPDRIYKGPVRLVTTVIFPIVVASSFPARIFLEPFDWKILAHFFGIITVFLFVLNWTWNRGLKTYTSASS